MPQKFTKPSMGERFKQLSYLLKNTVTIIGRDTDIIGPFKRMVIYSTVMITAFFACVIAYTLGASGIGTLLLLGAVLMFFYKYFYYIRQNMAQSWMVVKTLRGQDAVPGDGHQRVAGLKSQARGLGWASMAFAFMRSSQDEEKGGIMKVIMAALFEVWDLAKHFLTPAVTVDEYSLRDGLGQLKTLRHSVPETLVGVFGIDIAGATVATLMAPFYLLLIVAAIGVGLLLGDDGSAFYAGDARLLLDNLGNMMHTDTSSWLGTGALPFSWLPLLVAIWLGKIVSAIFARLVDSMKTIYFTIFYMRITHVDDIVPDLRQELEAYLRFENDTSTT